MLMRSLRRLMSMLITEASLLESHRVAALQHEAFSGWKGSEKPKETKP